jgi:multimeric flavodoxin WrbA
MNILVINGSPKGENSNSMKLTRAFLDGAGYDADVLHTAKLKIEPCLGCFACWEKTPGRCVIKDDMTDVLNKIIAADVIAWSFPLYYFSVPGALKNLIDRELPMNLPFMSKDNASGGHPPRYDLRRQRYAVLSTCGFWRSEGNYDGVTAMFDHMYGKGNYTKIFCGQGELFRVPELKTRTDAYLEIVRRAGGEFAQGEVTPGTQAELAEPLYTREAFERMADASWHTPLDKKDKKDKKNEKGANGSSLDLSYLNFIEGMAALYRPDGKERVLEFHFTDVDKTYQLLLTSGGSSVVADHFKPYTTRIETPYELWRSIARGEISGADALFQKKMYVWGDFDVMSRWNELFGPSAPTRNEKGNELENDKNLKTNMSVLLAPWIVIWVALAIDPIVGGVLGVMAAAAVPLIWLLFKPTVFERISVLAVAGLSLWALIGANALGADAMEANARMVLSTSYGVFGLMWFVTVWCKVPLTAYYSQNSYGGAKALKNPLFMRTNRILTAVWGIFYLLTPFWTYKLLTTAAAPFAGLINIPAPAVLGVFTAWFQKWYPARWARGGSV